MKASVTVCLSWFATLALCTATVFGSETSDMNKIAGFYISRKPYQSLSISGNPLGLNAQSLVFHPDGTMTRTDSDSYSQWGFAGTNEGGLYFNLPNNGVWEIVKEKSKDTELKGGKKIWVRAVFFQYSPESDYPPPATGMPSFYDPASFSATIRRCWEYEFSDLKDGKFQKCTGLKTSAAILSPLDDPLSTEIPQGSVTPGSASGHLPVFSRVTVKKQWFKNF